MKNPLYGASLVILGMALGTAISALAANPPAKQPAKPSEVQQPKASGKLSPVPPPPPPSAREFETVEYKFYVLNSVDAATDNHERDLNSLGAQGWRIVSPIYAGGILNSYLMMRIHPNK